MTQLSLEEAIAALKDGKKVAPVTALNEKGVAAFHIEVFKAGNKDVLIQVAEGSVNPFYLPNDIYSTWVILDK